MAFLQYMDSLSIGVALVLMIVTLWRITQVNKMQHTLWFAGSVSLMFVVAVSTRDVSLAVNPYIQGIIAFSLGLLAAGYLTALDKEGKYAQYFTIYILTAALVFSMAMHYVGSVTGDVLGTPLFLLSIGLSLVVLVLAPLAMMSAAGFHAIWAAVGWVLITIAGWYQWSAATERLVLEGDSLSSIVFTLLTIGLILILVSFANTKWLAEDADMAA